MFDMRVASAGPGQLVCVSVVMATRPPGDVTHSVSTHALCHCRRVIATVVHSSDWTTLHLGDQSTDKGHGKVKRSITVEVKSTSSGSLEAMLRPTPTNLSEWKFLNFFGAE